MNCTEECFLLRYFIRTVLLLVICFASVFSADAYPRRIVSLSPVGTEILFALGQGGNIIGVTNFCDYPPEALKKPKVGDFAALNFEMLVAGNVDLLVLQDIHKQFLPQLKQLKIPYIVLEQETVSGVYSSIARLGRACGAEKRAAALTGSIKKEIAAVGSKVQKLSRPQVVLCVSRELAETQINSFYAAGSKTFYNELIKLAGGKNSLAFDTAAYPHVASEGLMKINPDIIIDLVGDKNFYHSKDNVDLDKVFNKKYLTEQWLRSVKVKATASGHVSILTGTLYLRPGPRMGTIVRDFARAVHPEVKW